MTFVNFSAHAPNPIASGPQAAIDSAATAPAGSFTFDDALDIVNPLQHIPVVGTLYRAITGDTIKTGPKLAGDTLYGGLTGLISSVADTMFEKITGKNVGDTVLAMVENAFSPSNPAPDTAIASAAPGTLSLPASSTLAAIPGNTDLATLTAPQAPVAVNAAEQDAIVIPGQDELLLALSRSGIGKDIALRAADAYRRTISVSSSAADGALPSEFRASIAQ